MTVKHFGCALMAVATAAMTGCCSTRSGGLTTAARPSQAVCSNCAPTVAPSTRFAPVPAPVAPPGLPPGAVLTPPAGAAVISSGVTPGSYTPAPPAPVPAPAAPTPAPQEPTARLAPPESTNALPAQTAEPPVASIPSRAAETRDAAASLPADIPQFAMARTKVASGHQPFPDGVAWLQAHGYRTVLFIRAPGSDEVAAQRQFEKHGLRYLSLEVDPRALTKETVDRFNKLVTDDANLPLFVYDKDSSLAGGLWYLHYRLVEGWSDDKARIEADRLGFRQDRDDNHRTMWIAVQKLLEANGR